jgi:predicted TPR repeat methyltransferase
MAARRHEAALAQLADGRPAAAVASLRQALALDGKMVRAHNNLGIALRQVGLLDEAEAAYRDSLRVEGTYTPAHHNLGELLQHRGRLEEARGCFESVLRVDPTLNRSRISLGNTLADLGALDEAVACYEEAILRSAHPAGIYIGLGIVKERLGDSSGAISAFERAVAGNPASADAHFHLGRALLASGQFAAATQSACEALRLKPGFAEALMVSAGGLAGTDAITAALDLLPDAGEPDMPTYQRCALLGAWLMSSGFLEPARHCLEAALREEPGDVMAGHLLTALKRDNPEHPVDGYVRQLFDSGAATFDFDLVSKLGYAIPREMVQELRTVHGSPAQPWSVLDLGCGTGLVAVEIAQYSHSLVGIDIAPKMVERARSRAIYTSLHCADLMTGLRLDDTREARYDVITAADVFIYVGKLDAVIPEIRSVLNVGGLLAFSAEAMEDTGVPGSEGYRLGIWGRYEHSEHYLRRLAAQHRFDVILFRKARIRFESGVPVEGWLTIWRAS